MCLIWQDCAVVVLAGVSRVVTRPVFLVHPNREHLAGHVRDNRISRFDGLLPFDEELLPLQRQLQLFLECSGTPFVALGNLNLLAQLPLITLADEYLLLEELQYSPLTGLQLHLIARHEKGILTAGNEFPLRW